MADMGRKLGPLLDVAGIVIVAHLLLGVVLAFLMGWIGP